jgi:hypothetical protein
MKPGAPIIQPRVKTKDKPGKPTNISLVSIYGHGNVDAGFEQADMGRASFGSLRRASLRTAIPALPCWAWRFRNSR